MNLPGAFQEPKVFRKRAVVSTIIVILDSGLFENWVISVQKYEFCVFLHLNFWRGRAVADSLKMLQSEACGRGVYPVSGQLPVKGFDWTWSHPTLQELSSVVHTLRLTPEDRFLPLNKSSHPLTENSGHRECSKNQLSSELRGAVWKMPSPASLCLRMPCERCHWCQTIHRNRCVITAAGPEQGCVPNNAPFQIYLISKKSCHQLIVLTSPFTISAFLQINTKPDAALLSLANEYSLSAW